VLADDATTVVPNVVEALVGQMHADTGIGVEDATISPGANGEVVVDVSLTVQGSYGELATVEDTLADAIVEHEFELSTEDAKSEMGLN